MLRNANEIRFAEGMRILVYPKPDHTPATFTIQSLVEA
jgi:hypothetical protein